MAVVGVYARLETLGKVLSVGDNNLSAVFGQGGTHRVLRCWLKITAVSGSPDLILRRQIFGLSPTIDVLKLSAIASPDAVAQEIVNFRGINLVFTGPPAADTDLIIANLSAGTMTIDITFFGIKETGP